MNIPSSPVSSVPSNDVTNVSSENLIRCPQCSQPRFFKGQRGLKIHVSRIHHSITNNVQAINQAPSTLPIPPSEPFHKTLSYLKHSHPIIKRIPRGARTSVALALSSAITKVLSENTLEAWEHLFTFSYRILHISSDPNNQLSLTQRIKHNCSFNLNSSCFFTPNSPTHASTLSDGNIKGAARILFSDDLIAPSTPDTLSALKSKHPPSATNSQLPDSPDPTQPALQTTPEALTSAINSFSSGSAGGMDGLTPQHLKDLVSVSCGEAGTALLKNLVSLVNLMLSGGVNPDFLKFLYGANLCAFKKKDGGIRPIAVGCTFRRLAAKICCRAISDGLAAYFEPVQLGFGIKGGCEAAIHSLRTEPPCCHKSNRRLLQFIHSFGSVTAPQVICNT
ncbi:hypothetical protein ABMA28_004148 [Loxostege sticticalis]|uniref:Reverse transcriptase n=1 Tax=Loxostege sticticalis TaxID=481309 RepID=A0ABD0SUF5_LOXSC